MASNKEPTIKCSCKPFGLVLFGSVRSLLFCFSHISPCRRFILIAHRKTPYEFHYRLIHTHLSIALSLALTRSLTHSFRSLFIKYQIRYLYFCCMFFDIIFSRFECASNDDSSTCVVFFSLSLLVNVCFGFVVA